MEMVHTLVFSIAELKQEIEKRTSYTGKMRSTEKEPYLSDRLSLTDGESFLSDSYIEEAASETYDWIKAFGRGVQDAFRVHRGEQFYKIEEACGVHIWYENEGIKYPISLSSPESIPFYYMAGERNGDIIRVETGFRDPLNVRMGSASQIDYCFKIHYTTYIPNTPFEEECTQKEMSSTTNGLDLSEIYINLGKSVLGRVELKSIDNIELEILNIEPQVYVDIHKGDTIEYTLLDGSKWYGITEEDKLHVSYKDMPTCTIYTQDIRNTIIYTLNIPEWQDENMLRKVRNDLQEALVNYVIWRWFETVNPSEASIYYDKWEEKAHGAQLGLNTEKHVLQRKATWF